MSYLAKISKCYRDVASGDVKVLLRDIHTEENGMYRDHAWVSINKELKKILDTIQGNKSYIVKFNAKEKIYRSSSTEKKTLTAVSNIKVLGRA